MAYFAQEVRRYRNKSDVAKEVGARVETIENYITILEQTFQAKLVRPYFENIGKQFVKARKYKATIQGWHRIFWGFTLQPS